jgi:hypothetical protein
MELEIRLSFVRVANYLQRKALHHHRNVSQMVKFQRLSTGTSRTYCILHTPNNF